MEAGLSLRGNLFDGFQEGIRTCIVDVVLRSVFLARAATLLRLVLGTQENGRCVLGSIPDLESKESFQRYSESRFSEGRGSRQLLWGLDSHASSHGHGRKRDFWSRCRDRYFLDCEFFRLRGSTGETHTSNSPPEAEVNERNWEPIFRDLRLRFGMQPKI